MIQGPDSPVHGFAEGAPDWLAPALRNCSRCGGRLAYGPVPGEDRQRHCCTECGSVTYVNPRVVVTTLPVTAAGELVLIRRAIPPGYGTWAQPGGFLEADETVIQGAVRETLEETGLHRRARPHRGHLLPPRRPRSWWSPTRPPSWRGDDRDARIARGQVIRGGRHPLVRHRPSTPRSGRSGIGSAPCGRTSTSTRSARRNRTASPARRPDRPQMRAPGSTRHPSRPGRPRGRARCRPAVGRVRPTTRNVEATSSTAEVLARVRGQPHGPRRGSTTIGFSSAPSPCRATMTRNVT